MNIVAASSVRSPAAFANAWRVWHNKYAHSIMQIDDGFTFAAAAWLWFWFHHTVAVQLSCVGGICI